HAGSSLVSGGRGLVDRRSLARSDAPDGGLLEVAQAVAPALDVEHVALVQEPIEDRGRQDLVAGEHLGPVLDALVGRDEDAAAAIAIADEPEEQARLGSSEQFEAERGEQASTWKRATSAKRRYAMWISPQAPAPEAIAVFSLSMRTVAGTPPIRFSASR